MDKIFLRLESNNNLKYITCIVQYARRLIRSANSVDPMDNRIALDPSGASPQACWSVRVTDRRTRLLIIIGFVCFDRVCVVWWNIFVQEHAECRRRLRVKTFSFSFPPRGEKSESTVRGREDFPGDVRRVYVTQ